MTRRKTDGERIADKAFIDIFGYASQRDEKKRLSDSIDRLLRRRMAQAWEEGRIVGFDMADAENPYRVKRRKK